MTGITLEFTQDGRINAHGAGQAVQVGTLAADPPETDGNRGWTAVLWQFADTAPEPGVNNGKVAGLRFADDERTAQAKVRAALSYGTWWLPKAA
jgi:hypothetical protein